MDIKVDFSFSSYGSEEPRYKYLRIRSTELYLKEVIKFDGFVFLKDILKSLGFPINSCKEYGVPKTRLSKSYTSLSIEVDNYDNPQIITIYGE